MPLSRKILILSAGEKCENWSVFSKYIDKVQYLCFGLLCLTPRSACTGIVFHNVRLQSCVMIKQTTV